MCHKKSKFISKAHLQQHELTQVLNKQRQRREGQQEIMKDHLFTQRAAGN